MMQILSSLHEVWDRYDAFFVDIWGVLHDGARPYPFVQETLDELARAGKYVVLLSNAPRRVERAMKGLAHVGLNARSVHHMVTSGAMTLDYLHAHYAHKKMYFLGSASDEDLLDGTNLPRVRDVACADYVLNVGHFYDGQPLHELQPLLHAMQQRTLPMVCANPDKEIITQEGVVFPCAGEIAYHYQALGGEVHFVGKPYLAVYERAHSLLPDAIASARILAIGDNPATDILGGQRYGIDTLLIAGGMWRQVLYPKGDALDVAQLHQLCALHHATPRYVLRYLSDKAR